MSLRAPLSFWMKVFQVSALAVALYFSLGATDAGSRYNDLNHRLMCTCGCSELLGECNHVGCQSSGGELSELRTGIAEGKSDKEILASFAVKYGATVLAAPTTHGFDLVAWIAPFAVFLAAMLGTILLVRRWSANMPAPLLPVSDPAMDARRQQVRRETGTEIDGGI
jgi:cytochrome c-type biogenesis protein CcmH